VLVRSARAAAARWVLARVGPGFRGAVFTGSTIDLPPDALLPPASDVDVAVVVGDGPLPPRAKQMVDGVPVDVGAVTEATLAGAATSWVWAPSFRGGQILADPTGRLAALEAAVAPAYATHGAVAARAADVRATIRARLTRLDPAAPWPALVSAWLFPTSLTAVLAQVAAGRTPTVRLRYRRARDVLATADRTLLLRWLGCERVDAAVVTGHLDALAERFDEAGRVLRTPFPFAADLAVTARPAAIEGSRALVAEGHHREAVFWVVATAARCHQVLSADAPALAGRRDRAFRTLVADLTGLMTPGDVLARRDDVLASIGSFPGGAPPRA
jgi:hypothetical protein